MAIDDILEDLLSKSQTRRANDPRGISSSQTNPSILGHDDYYSLIATLETECNKQYRDPGPGFHFVGILLAVFAAEVLSAYWARNQHAMSPHDPITGDVPSGMLKRSPPKLVSCLYSSDAVGFVLSHPTQVCPSDVSELTLAPYLLKGCR